MQTDPDCLVNLAGLPAYAGVLEEFRQAMRAQMLRTDDYLLEAFDVRSDQAKLRTFMRRLNDAAQERAMRLQWKRPYNIAGSARANRQLFLKKQNQ